MVNVFTDRRPARRDTGRQERDETPATCSAWRAPLGVAAQVSDGGKGQRPSRGKSEVTLKRQSTFFIHTHTVKCPGQDTTLP